MRTDELEERWRELTTDLARSIRDWRVAHPRTTLREIETALDERWAVVRARLLEDSAGTSPLGDVQAAQAAGVPVPCPSCGQMVKDQGQHTRQLTTQGAQTLSLERSYVVCPGCGAGLFPPG